MSLQFSSGASQFTFSVPGVGRYSGSVPTSLSVDGQGLHLIGSLVASFAPVAGTVATAPTIQMDGEIDLIHGRASIHLWDAQARYDLVSGSIPLGDVNPTTQAALAALGTNDWPALYTLFSSDITTNYTQAQFTTMMSSAGLPTFIDAAVAGPAVDQSVNGTTFAVQPIALTASSNGALQTYTARLQFIVDQGTWHLLSITNPTLA